MRDVFTMGARPIANLNSIHFGSTQHKKTRNLLRGVVKGIGGYGNCIGVPTIAGQTNFDESYNGNILVNAMTLGLVNKKKIFYSKAAGLDKPVIYVGSNHLNLLVSLYRNSLLSKGEYSHVILLH